MKKKIVALMLSLAMVLSMTACGGKGNETTEPAATEGQTTVNESNEVITLTLWGAEEDQNYLAARVEAFEALYPDKIFDIKIGAESESTAKDTVLTDIEAAADVFCFADDQLADLVNAGALIAIDDNMSKVLEAYAGKTLDDVKAANVQVSVEAATIGDTLYAFPTSADNGYFLYYDSNVFTEDDVKTWDGLLAAAEANGGGKKVGMTFASGWYNAGFFYGAGFTTDRNEDGTTSCDWNGTSPSGVTGVQVVQAMLDIASKPAFMPIADGDISNQIASGNLCAVVSGTWDSIAIEKAFGPDYVATTLPTYTVGDQQVQTGSVGGSKLMGVNAYCENSGWAVLLADFLTNEESQTIHFVERQVGPSNLNAQNSDEVAQNKAIAAVLQQSQYAVIQQVGGKFWDPSKTFGERIAQGQIASDDASVQTALDELVAGITAPLN